MTIKPALPWLMGLGNGLIGLIAAIYATHKWPALSETLILSSGLAGVVSGTLLFGLLVTLSKKPSVAKGAWTGIASGIIAHPLAWYFDIVRANFCSFWLHQPVCTGCPEPMTLVQGIPSAIAYSYVSLAIIGWLSVPLAGFMGSLLARWQERWYFSHLSTPRTTHIA